MRKLLLFVFIPIIFIACTKRNLVIITPEYQSKFINAEELSIQFVPEKPVIEINDEIISSLGNGSNEEIYPVHFEKNFPKFVKQNSTFKQVNFSSDIYQFDEKELPINKKDTILFKIPSHTQDETKNDNTIGNTLLLEDVKIYQKKGKDDILIPTTTGTIFITGNDPLIIHVGNFLIWDNNQNRIVSYGKFEIRTKIKKNKVEETWADAFNALSRQIFSNSPFQNRK